MLQLNKPYKDLNKINKKHFKGSFINDTKPQDYRKKS